MRARSSPRPTPEAHAASPERTPGAIAAPGSVPGETAPRRAPPDTFDTHAPAATRAPEDVRLGALAELRETTQATMATLRAAIAKANADRAALEVKSGAQAKEITGLVTALEAAHAEVDRNTGIKAAAGLLGAILTGGAAIPLLAGLYAAQQDSNAAERLRGELGRARDLERATAARLATYTAVKTDLEAKLDALEAAEANAVARINDSAVTGEPGARTRHAKPRHALVELAAAAQVLDTRATLLENLTAQLQLTEALRDAAGAIGVDLGEVIHDLRARVRTAEAAVAESRSTLRELLVDLGRGQPHHTFTRLAERKLYEQALNLLATRGITPTAVR